MWCISIDPIEQYSFLKTAIDRLTIFKLKSGKNSKIIEKKIVVSIPNDEEADIRWKERYEAIFMEQRKHIQKEANKRKKTQDDRMSVDSVTFEWEQCHEYDTEDEEL